MRTAARAQVPGFRDSRAYLLMEALVYIGLLFVVLGLGYAVVYRCIEQSVLLRRASEDIARALDAGERWRADVRSADKGISVDGALTNQLLHLAGSHGEVSYRFSRGAVERRVANGPWISILSSVKTSLMRSDSRNEVKAWRWELELQQRKRPNAQPGRVRPLFTFIAVPQPEETP